MMKKIMKRAHEIAKTMAGDYLARMSYALRQAWAEAKASTKKEFNGSVEMIYNFSENAYLTVSFKLWKNYGKCRIYFESYSTRAQVALKGFIDCDDNNRIIIQKSRYARMQNVVDEFLSTYAI